MPETSIHKHNNPLLSENKVRPTYDREVSPPTDDVVGAEYRDKSNLGCAIPTRANRRHHLRSFSLCKNVGHVVIRITDDYFTPVFHTSRCVSANSPLPEGAWCG